MPNPIKKASPRLRSLLVVIAALALAGCNTMRGTPTRYQSSDAIVAAIQLTPQDIADLAETQDGGQRNRLQNKAVAVIDQQYSSFVRSLVSDKADAATASAGATLGAATAAAFVDSVAAKTNYALFGATLIGAFGIIDKNYYFEKTAPALVSGMDAARVQALLQIKKNQQLGIDVYEGAAAVRDLETYYTAGTLIGAIKDITARAETTVAEGQGEIRALKVLPQLEMDRNQKIVAAVHAVKTPEDVQKGNVALKALGLKEQPDGATTRRALLQELRAGDSKRTDALEAQLKAAGLLN